MKNNPELLKEILNKIKNMPDSIIEKAIDELADELLIENIIYYKTICLEINYDIESESKEWKEELALAA